MKRLFIVFLALTQGLSAICATYYQNYNTPQNRINAAEMRIFGRTFNGNDDIARLERMENEIFGTPGNGDIYDRINLIEKVTTKKIPVGTQIMNNVKKAVNDRFYGYPTGFTPPIYTRNNYGYYRNTMPTYKGPNNFGFYQPTRQTKRHSGSHVNSSTIIQEIF